MAAFSVYLCSQFINFSLQRVSLVMMAAFNVYLCSQFINGSLQRVSLVPTAGFSFYLQYDGRVQRTNSDLWLGFKGLHAISVLPIRRYAV
jgi:hypothetical protein